MTNDQCLHFAELQIPEACRECIVRDVMVVDGIEYDEAMKVFDDIAITNREKIGLSGFPFYLGLSTSVLAAYASIPLVFDLNTVQWFNTAYVTTDLPEPKDLETFFEVGAWSWSWMEPVLGQVSFFLLCMQFAKSQMRNLGIRPYYNWQKEKRAAMLVEKYPKYDASFLRAYSRCVKIVEPQRQSIHG